jgi:hypothetical protein|uniref:J domain-containing protein n=1 Tax=viral metagenome TaxID=1070528 RepID=A0A6C0DLD3_9ZZZZ
MYNNPYTVLKISSLATVDEIKKAYRKIALKSHPDKINNISDINERNIKIKEFTDATNAYNQLLNNDMADMNINNWEETFDYIMNSQIFKDFINSFINIPSKIIKHEFKLDISYNDYYSKNKKKIRIFLKDLKEPIFIELDCKKYPKAIINYLDDNDNEHEIIFLLNIVNNNKNYYHIVNIDGSIDVIYDMIINTAEYLTGNIREHIFINKDLLLIKIEPFSNKFIINGMGINNGNFICNFIYTPIQKDMWDKLNTDDKNIIINLFNRIK